MTTNINSMQADWLIKIDHKNPSDTKIFYKGEQVGMVTGLSIDIAAGIALPKITFTTFLQNVKIEGI